MQVSINMLAKAAATPRTKTLLSVFGAEAITTGDKDEGPACGRSGHGIEKGSIETQRARAMPNKINSIKGSR